MGDSFFKVKRSKATEELLKDHNAWALLSLIAYRARRTNEFNIHNLKPGEALIGDHESCGLTQREYRTAKKNLEMWNLATFKATNKGTIAKLINSDIFDINLDDGDKQVDNQTTSKRQASDKQTTTNKNVKNEKNVKRETLSPEKLSQEEQRQKHLEYVFLTPGEYLALTEKLGAARRAGLIEDLNNYIGSKGRSYKSHYHTLLAWAKKDRQSNSSTQAGSHDDIASKKLKAKYDYEHFIGIKDKSPEEQAQIKASICKKHKVEDF